MRLIYIFNLKDGLTTSEHVAIDRFSRYEIEDSIFQKMKYPFTNSPFCSYMLHSSQNGYNLSAQVNEL
ncbi:hypothetical protein [Sphingobacterium multivorum]|uniref:hypothetical protein n=1 Tax=Sphingobacterium multivorum TaxID=28454 RepID=UPI0028A9ADB4|nr:hypothetical protein [Sphingobacterium multivorum]